MKKEKEIKKATPKSDSCVELPRWIAASLTNVGSVGATDIFLIESAIAPTPFKSFTVLLSRSTLPGSGEFKFYLREDLDKFAESGKDYLKKVI